MYNQNLSEKKKLGWTIDHKNLVVARFTIVGTSRSNAHLMAMNVANSAKDAKSRLRRLGSIGCCCVQGKTSAGLDPRQNSWPQYWAFMVSPIFYGYKSDNSFSVKSKQTRDKTSYIYSLMRSALLRKELDAYRAIRAYDFSYKVSTTDYDAKSQAACF